MAAWLADPIRSRDVDRPIRARSQDFSSSGGPIGARDCAFWGRLGRSGRPRPPPLHKCMPVSKPEQQQPGDEIGVWRRAAGSLCVSREDFFPRNYSGCPPRFSSSTFLSNPRSVVYYPMFLCRMMFRKNANSSIVTLMKECHLIRGRGLPPPHTYVSNVHRTMYAGLAFMKTRKVLADFVRLNGGFLRVQFIGALGSLDKLAYMILFPAIFRTHRNSAKKTTDDAGQVEMSVKKKKLHFYTNGLNLKCVFHWDR